MAATGRPSLRPHASEQGLSGVLALDNDTTDINAPGPRPRLATTTQYAQQPT